jgi:hypothetical protein
MAVALGSFGVVEEVSNRCRPQLAVEFESRYPRL